MTLALPPAFVQRQLDLNGERGRAWVDRLPELIAEFERRWHITVGTPFDLSYNFVAPATQAESGAACVFKAVAPYLDADTEGDALALYAGQGAARLLQRDIAGGVLLLERCLPGDELATLFPDRDDEASAIAGDIMVKLWRPLTSAHPFTPLDAWTGVLERLYGFFGGTAGPMDKRVVDAAIGLRRELLAHPPETVLLHGDLHHHNILRTFARATVAVAGKSDVDQPGWLAIDPKGLVGEKAYEPGCLFYNPVGEWHTHVDGPRLTRRRADIIVAHTGLDLKRLLGWAVVQGIVSSAWDYEGGGEPGGCGAEMTAAWAWDALRTI